MSPNFGNMKLDRGSTYRASNQSKLKHEAPKLSNRRRKVKVGKIANSEIAKEYTVIDATTDAAPTDKHFDDVTKCFF